MSIIFNQKPVGWYVEKLKNKEYFSFAGFSDAEWLAMEKSRIGNDNRTGGGQLYTERIADDLLSALRLSDPTYLKAAPLCMYDEKWVYGAVRMVRFLMEHKIPEKDWVFYERDMVTDDLARLKGIGAWIKQLREMDTVFVSNKYVANIKYFMPYKHFVEIPKLDVYEEEDWLNKYSQKVLDYGKPAVYIFSAGFAAAPLVARLHGKIPNSWFLDLGSIWDCFTGIGSQRGWRGELYGNLDNWRNWLETVLEGIDYDKAEAERVRDEGFNRVKIKGLENG